ncbi:FxLYD domain-containing protein [Streptomyces marokkonensis]|uniref:FxLYD domain-containing protein n=1 Tax=Streptomyces marokkonensis TaxID=324855 RepID=UPI0011F15BEF|nr:FxLYD domain-containing protein [Streptomyces marokkonensis]
MTRARRRGAAGAAALTALLVGGVAGCTDEGNGAGPPASSAASRATEVWESATAEAGRGLEEFTRGLDVRDDVSLGAPTVPADGRASVEVTVRNTDDSARSFLVQVDFRDADGDLVDVALVTVDDVAAGGSAQATARGTHDLSFDARPEVARAVRY